MRTVVTTCFVGGFIAVAISLRVAIGMIFVLEKKVARLEREAMPPHMVNLERRADGKLWINDPNKPWVQPMTWDEYQERFQGK